MFGFDNQVRKSVVIVCSLVQFLFYTFRMEMAADSTTKSPSAPSECEAGSSSQNCASSNNEADRADSVIIIEDSDSEQSTKGDDDTFDFDSILDSVQTNNLSVEQIYILICIWGRQHEDTSAQAKEDLDFFEKYLKAKLEQPNPLEPLPFEDAETGKRICKILDNFIKSIQKFRECGLCKLFVHTKICMRSCVNQMLADWHKPLVCPFRLSGLSSLAMKEIKEDVKLLHQTRCCCLTCAKIVVNYDKFVDAVTMHEDVHKTRKD